MCQAEFPERSTRLGNTGGDAVIVLLLHHHGGTDTLSTNARPEFGLQFNRVTVRDSVLVRRSHYNMKFVEENFPDDIYPFCEEIFMGDTGR